MLQFLYPIQLGVLHDTFPVQAELLDPQPTDTQTYYSSGYQWVNDCIYYLNKSVCAIEPKPQSIVELVTLDFRQGSMKRVRKSTVLILTKDQDVFMIKCPVSASDFPTLLCQNVRFLRQRTDNDAMFITISGEVYSNGHFLPDQISGGVRSLAEYNDGYLILSMTNYMYRLDKSGLAQLFNRSVTWFRQLSETAYAYTTATDRSVYVGDNGMIIHELDGVPRSSCVIGNTIYLLTYQGTVHKTYPRSMRSKSYPGAVKVSVPDEWGSYPRIHYENGETQSLTF